MKLQTKNNERGFTIVELLIVIIVIGILATLVLVAYSNVQAQARDTKRQADATSIRDAATVLKNGTVNAGSLPQITNSGFTSDINANTNVQLDAALMANVNVGYTAATNNTAGTGGPTSTNPERYLIQYCPLVSGTTAATATGFKVTYWQETKSGGAGTQTLFVGNVTC